MNRKSFKSTNFIFGILMVSVLVLAACQPAVVPVTGALETAIPATLPKPTASATEVPATIQVATDAVLGDILVDSKGMTLYMFTKDEPDKSNCAGKCLEAWPPLIAGDDTTVAAGLDAALLGETALPDGSMIVTYNHMPLYYWAADVNPGDTTGQDVNQVWYVVSADGKPVGMQAADVLIKVASDPVLGDILVDNKGMTLYMFTKDEANKSNCAGGCLQAWPPLLAVENPTVGDGLNASLLGSADLPDGTKIVTYNKMPLYYWAKDMAPGETTGQNVNDVWFVVSPDGKPVGMPAADENVLIKVSKDPILGDILVDGKGMTLYMFTKDEADKSNCADKCLEAWPPLLAVDNPIVGEGVDDSLLGTATLPDGSLIVTYNKMPLYYWVADVNPGDTSGQNVNEVWFVVSPDGKPVGMPEMEKSY